jgi:hypothetical protein
MFGRRALIAVAVLSALVGAHSLNPRDLYNEMYPVEALKRDAFHICDAAEPTFIRAVKEDREACLNSMPHVIELALGRVRPSALTMAALQAELLMTLGAMPPRQPITLPRSFANVAWLRTLSAPCNDPNRPAVTYIAPAGLPPPPGTGRAAVLDGVNRNLPAMPRRAAVATARRDSVPVISLAPGRAATAPMPASDDLITASGPLPAPDVGDAAAPAIVPLAPASACGGA